ncbi:MAG TPA: carboxypeptidase regulatory-like domain-containing protein [Kiritimatiellia bacterium]|nr:carboxypeptidase regulatory-like domain-containing protein [Kiritimatiellia bacterium]
MKRNVAAWLGAILSVSVSFGATITGTVTDGYGNPLADISVSAYRNTGMYFEQEASVDTTAFGAYSLTGLPPGTYRIQFRDWSGDYATEWYHNVLYEHAASLIELFNPWDVVTEVDAELDQATAIGGLVTDSDMNPLVHIWVLPYLWEDGEWRALYDFQDSTFFDGVYNLRGLPQGIYILEFIDGGDGLYAKQYYSGKTSKALADSFYSGPGLTKADAVMVMGSSISGTITGPNGVTPLEAAYAVVYHSEDLEDVAIGYSDEDGFYTVAGLAAGSYIVYFAHWDEAYAPEWYDDVYDVMNATRILVGPGEAVTGINASLSAGGGGLSGTVVDSDMNPVAGVMVRAHIGPNYNGYAYEFTDENGYYEILPLSPGPYKVEFFTAWYQSAWWNGKTTEQTADVLTMEGDMIENIDAVLTKATAIGGRVTDGDGIPIPYIMVDVAKQTGSSWDWVAFDRSDEQGRYAMSLPGAGTYIAWFRDTMNNVYTSIYYENADDSAGATPIVLGNGEWAEDIDVVMTARADQGISGTVVDDENGIPLPNIWAQALAWDGFDWEMVEEAQTGEFGHYVIRPLPAGSYRVRFYDPWGEYITEYYDDQSSVDLATDVDVFEDEVTGGIDAALVRAGDIPLPVALDNDTLIWVTGGNAPWRGQEMFSHDGVDAAQSGLIADSQQTWLETTVTGPGTLSYWYQVSSEENYDFFIATRNGTDVLYEYSGETGWLYAEHLVPAGSHTFRWTYIKDFIVSSGFDAVWMDQVVWTPDVNQPPVWVSSPETNATAGVYYEYVLNAMDPNGQPVSFSGVALPSWLSVTTVMVAGVDGTSLITTFAGTGAAGYSGDNGPATDAQVNVPYSVATDAAGAVYLADSQNHRIRKVGLDGVIHTVAGSGSTPYNGDSIPAVNAGLNLPLGIAVDAAGNLFIADYYHHRVRKVDTNGVITTYAGTGVGSTTGDGGPATSATLNLPTDVAWDASGNLFITEYGGHRVRKVAPDGIITTYGGGGSSLNEGILATTASLTNPYGIEVDTQGRVYVSQYLRHIVRRIDTNGLIYTVAGTGTDGFSGDGGPATSAALNNPGELAVDGEGRLYIADVSNHRLRRVGTNGIIETLVGQGVAGDDGDGGPAPDARLNYPYSVAVGPDGSVYLADTVNHRIRRIESNRRVVVLAGTPAASDVGETEITLLVSDGIDDVPQSFTLQVVAADPDHDSDGDGIPDWWEELYGLDASVSNAVASNADGDWMTDWEEYIADTHPVNPGSTFPEVAPVRSADNTMIIVIDPTSTGRVYGVWATTNLKGNPPPWILVGQEKWGSGGALQFVITNDVPNRIYRTAVRLP